MKGDEFLRDWAKKVQPIQPPPALSHDLVDVMKQLAVGNLRVPATLDENVSGMDLFKEITQKDD
jgi:hypothetical protein